MTGEREEYLVEGKYGIRDLVDVERLRNVFERFSEATGFTIGFVEYPSLEILVATGWRDICTRFHRGQAVSLENCAKSNIGLTGHMREPGQLVVEECENGLVDCATPIIIRGIYVATLATGQVLTRSPDLERFRKQAKMYGYDEEEYLAALQKVRIVSEEELRRMVSFLSEFATFIAEMGLRSLELREKSRALEEEMGHRREAEGALKESENRFRAIFDSVNDAIFIHDPGTGVILDVNERMCEMYGYTREEALQLRVDALSEGAPPYSWKEATEWLRKAVEEPQVARWRARHKDGRLFWVEAGMRCAVVGGEDRLLVTIRDITERVHGEEMLKQTEEKYRAIFDNSIMGIFQTAPTGRILSANRALARLHGFESAEELIREVTNIGEQLYVRKEDRPRLLDLYRTKGYVEGFEAELYRKDGSTAWVSMNARVVRDGEGRVLFYEGSAEDITERRRAEEALRESERLHRLLAENVTDLISRHGPDGKILYVTPSAEKVLGYRPDELVGRPVGVCVPEDDEAEAHRAVLDALRRGDDRYSVEHRMIRKDGRRIWVETAGRFMTDDEGNLKEVHCSARDITARKQLEAEVLKKRTLESIGTLAGGIAHDFNNLLMAVTGYISIAKTALPDTSEEYGFLTEAERISLGGKDLTRKLITFSEGGISTRKVLSLVDLVTDSSHIALAGANTECIFSLADDLFPVEGDELQLGQAVHNIVLNAREAMPEGGWVGIEGTNITLSGDENIPLSPGDYVKISIEDNGRGIRKEDLPKIFDPYFTTKGMGAERGMGLGLAVAYSAVKRHNGHVIVESIPGKGTAVHLYLPAYTGVKKQEAATPPPSEKRILFMDDDDNVRTIGGKLIARLGYKVSLAANGNEALALYADALHSEEPFDAVILDLTIKGGMGGKETFDRIRSIDPHIKAIISSGYTDDPAISRYREYGFKGVMTKPYKVEDLKELLKEVTG